MSTHVTHAGGVTFRRENGVATYLLTTTRSLREWVLPKGHVEPGESLEEAALREVLEETGVLGQIRERLPQDFRIRVNGRDLVVAFFLMERVEEREPLERRRIAWLPIDRAVERATHAETKAALKLAAASMIAHGA